jgi:hypothetical protein
MQRFEGLIEARFISGVDSRRAIGMHSLDLAES